MTVLSDLLILIFCLTVLLCLHVIQGINQYGQGVCSERSNTGDWYFYCCFNFYLKNGKCTECENGTVSNDGISCTICTGNMYGHQCKFRCSCLAEQRCDRRLGCVYDFDLMSTEAKVTISGDFKTSTTIIKHYIPADYKTSTTITKNYNPADSKTKYFYYILTGAVLVIFTILCVSCITFVHKRRNDRTQNLPTETLRAPVGVPLRPISQTSHHIYHTIDDSVVLNIQHMSPHNEDGGLKCCHLPNSLMRSEMMQTASRVSFDSTNSFPYGEFDELDYLNPYTTLKEKGKRDIVINEYETISKWFESSKNWICDNEKGRRFSIPIGTDFANFIVVQDTIHSAHNDQSLKSPMYRKCSTF